MAPGLEAEGEGARVGGLLVPGAGPQRPGETRLGAGGGVGLASLFHLWGRGWALRESLHPGGHRLSPPEVSPSPGHPGPCLTSSNLRAL